MPTPRKPKASTAQARKQFESESHLCSGLIEYARSKGFKAYAETSEFDVILVATEVSAKYAPLFAPGEQIGVHAKLKPGVEVLHQAMPRQYGYHTRKAGTLTKEGPHYYAILVPFATQEFVELAQRLGIYVMTALVRASAFSHIGYSHGDLAPLPGYGLVADTRRAQRGYTFTYQRMDHITPCWVPEVEVETPAGVKSPRQITPWKMAAVRLCVLGLEKGYLTTVDFKAAKVDMSRWFQKGWIKAHDWVVENGKRMKRYVIDESKSPPHLQYPEVIEALGKGGLI